MPTEEEVKEVGALESPCTIKRLRGFLTEAADRVPPLNLDPELADFVQGAEIDIYEGRPPSWEFTDKRVALLVSVLQQSDRELDFGDLHIFLTMLSLPEEMSQYIEVDLEKGQFRMLAAGVRFLESLISSSKEEERSGNSGLGEDS